MNARLLSAGRLLLAKRSRRAAPRRGLRRGAGVAVATGVLAFAAVQAALSSVSAVTHWVADPVYADKERRLARVERAAPPGAARVVLLGTSRTGYGFAAGRVSGPGAVAFNFGVPGAGPIAHLIYLRRLLADGHRPDLLVVEVLPPLLADPPEGPLEGRMLKGDLLTRDEIRTAGRYGLSVERLRREWRAAAVLPAYEHRFKLLGRVLPRALPWQLRYDSGRPADPNGWGASFSEEVAEEDRARGTAAAAAEYREVLKHDLPAGPGAAALRDLLELCRSERIPAALVLFPEAAPFRALYPPHTGPKLVRFLAGLSAEFGCPVADAREWIADDRFLDSHHLLRPGAVQFTDRLARELIAPLLRPGAVLGGNE